MDDADNSASREEVYIQSLLGTAEQLIAESTELRIIARESVAHSRELRERLVKIMRRKAPAKE